VQAVSKSGPLYLMTIAYSAYHLSENSFFIIYYSVEPNTLSPYHHAPATPSGCTCTPGFKSMFPAW